MKKFAVISLFFCIFICNLNIAFAQDSSINNGLSWLLNKQDPSGFWGDLFRTPVRDTCTVIDTLSYINATNSTNYSNGIQWLLNSDATTIDYLSRIIFSLSMTGNVVQEDVTSLLSLRNTDGGWGLDYGHRSDSLDTALALQALKAANYLDQNIISSALGFLLSTQNPDGGWGFYPAACATCQADPSNCYMTALVTSTLQQFAPTTSLVKAINKATGYLVAQQNGDGGFGSSQSTIYETALAYIALVGVITDETILGKAANYLTSQQLADGSWLDDPYATALAVKALYLAANKPQPPPPPDKGTATGKVIDSSTNALLKAVSVTLESDAGINTMTDQAGTFTLANCPPGTQKLIFTLPGYTGGSASLTITAGTIVDLGTIPLAPNPTTGMVKGLVTESATGMPLAGVVIDMTGSATATTTTAADGTFSFIDVTPGAVTLTASKAGYYAVTGSGSVLAGGTLFFNPQLPTTPPATLTGSLIGKVYDAATDQPIQGASITLASGPSATTGSNGAFTITDIAANTYEITIAASGYIAQTYQVMIMAGVTINMQTIYLIPTSQSTTITGKITDASTGTAIAGANVLIPNLGIATKSSSDGSYTLSGITLLGFTIKASAIGYNTKVINVETSTYGVSSIDIQLDRSQVSSIKITSIALDKTEYQTNETVNITATIENTGSVAQDVLMSAQVLDSKGNIFALIFQQPDSILHMNPNSTATISLQWNTGEALPGIYGLTLNAEDPTNINLLATSHISFVMKHTISIKMIAPMINPKYINITATETVYLSASLVNGSNVDASLSAEYEIKDPKGNVISNGRVEFSIATSESLKVVELCNFTHTFSDSGQYPVKINVISGNTILAVGSDAIHVSPSTRIEPSKKLNPATVLPDGDKRIKIEIHLEGIEDK